MLLPSITLTKAGGGGVTGTPGPPPPLGYAHDWPHHHHHTLFKHGKNISYKNITLKKKTDLHVCRVGARGRHRAIDKSFKVAKGSSSSGIVGKAIPQLCPTVTETSF